MGSEKGKLIYNAECDTPRLDVGNNIKALKMTELNSIDSAVTEVHLQVMEQKPCCHKKRGGLWSTAP